MKKGRHCNKTYKSGLEETVADQILEVTGIVASYESKDSVVKYTKPESYHKYTPDFKLHNGIIVETKGIFNAADRAKHMLVRKQHPNIDIRFVFSNSKAKISKGSKTTYADWCNKNGFKFADKKIPTVWFTEPIRDSTLK